MRPLLIPVWRTLPLTEQKRALRHLRPYWDVHRHRIAPEVDARLQGLRASGRLRLLAGSLVVARARPEALEIEVRRRGGDAIEALRADWLINCTGPTTAFDRIGDPLVRALLGRGTATPDPMGLGLAVTPDCNVIDVSGRPHERLYATGPLNSRRLLGNACSARAAPASAGGRTPAAPERAVRRPRRHFRVVMRYFRSIRARTHGVDSQ